MDLSEAIAVLSPPEHLAGAVFDHDEVEALRVVLASLSAVSALHHRRAWNTGVQHDFVHFGQTEFPDLCDHCRRTWPCETAKAASLDA